MAERVTSWWKSLADLLHNLVFGIDALWAIRVDCALGNVRLEKTDRIQCWSIGGVGLERHTTGVDTRNGEYSLQSDEVIVGLPVDTLG